jgi:hypothetical protein
MTLALFCSSKYKFYEAIYIARICIFLIKIYIVKLNSDMFSSTGYNSTIFESHLLVSFSNKNPLTLLAELVRAGPMIVKICPSWCIVVHAV